MAVTTPLRSRMTRREVAGRTPEPVTVTVARVVRPHRRQAFERWAADVLTLPEALEGGERRVRDGLERWVAKPLHGREGDNIRIHHDDMLEDVVMPGDYGAEGWVYQAYTELPSFEGHRVVLGSWIVAGEAARILVPSETTARDLHRYNAALDA